MKYSKKHLLIPIFALIFGTQAAETVYSGAAVTIGANSIVYGNLQVVAAATIGADSEIGGDIVAGGAITLGAAARIGEDFTARDAGTIGADATVGGNLTTGDAATLGATTINNNVMVGGNLKAGSAVLVGVKSAIGGDLTSGASAELGASAKVGGNAIARTALTLGADAIVGDGNEGNGNAQAGSGALFLGERAQVIREARAGTIVTVPSSASVGSIVEGEIEQFTSKPKGPIDSKKEQLTQLQEAMADRFANEELATTMAVDTELTPGVYHTTSLTTTAGITLTLNGNNQQGAEWLINIDTFINFGADLTIALENVADDSTVIFNAGGFTAIGANSNLMGIIYANTYITTGAGTKLTGIGDACGGLFTTNGAITLGANNIIGQEHCVQKSVFNLPVLNHNYPNNPNNPNGAVNLGTAADFVILAKTGVSSTGTTNITGDVGASPNALTSVTGFSVVLDSTNEFAKSYIVDGKIYSADMTPPTPAKMTTAISDMETAYTDAAGKPAGITELGAGDISGMTLAPGIYKWSTHVWINTDVTLEGDENAVWIFQISGDLIQASATNVILNGGAKTENIIWQVGGGAGVKLDTTASFAGIVLAQKAIVVSTGATVNGRLLSQTAVTLDANSVNIE